MKPYSLFSTQKSLLLLEKVDKYVDNVDNFVLIMWITMCKLRISSFWRFKPAPVRNAALLRCLPY